MHLRNCDYLQMQAFHHRKTEKEMKNETVFHGKNAVIIEE